MVYYALLYLAYLYVFANFTTSWEISLFVSLVWVTLEFFKLSIFLGIVLQAIPHLILDYSLLFIISAKDLLSVLNSTLLKKQSVIISTDLRSENLLAISGSSSFFIPTELSMRIFKIVYEYPSNSPSFILMSLTSTFPLIHPLSGGF